MIPKFQIMTAALALAVGSFTPAGMARAQETVTIGTPGIPPVFIAVQVFVAQEQKLFEKYGVKVCAPLNLPSEMPLHASTLYSRNLAAFVTAFWKDKAFTLDLNDDIQKASVITHGGQIVHEPTKSALQAVGT